VGNSVAKSKANIMKLGATNGDRFEGNDFRNNPGVGFSLSGATNTTYVNNQTDPGVSLP
jgi:parallel beta-helix repeat protein